MGEHGEGYKNAEEYATELYQSNELYYADLAKMSMESLKYVRGLSATIKELVGTQEYDSAKEKASEVLRNTNVVDENLANSNDYIEPLTKDVELIVNWLLSDKSGMYKLSSKDKKRLSELRDEISKILESEEIGKDNFDKDKKMSFKDRVVGKIKSWWPFSKKDDEDEDEADSEDKTNSENKADSDENSVTSGSDEDDSDQTLSNSDAESNQSTEAGQSTEADQNTEADQSTEAGQSTENNQNAEYDSSNDNVNSGDNKSRENVSDNENKQSNLNVQNEVLTPKVQNGADDETIEEKIRKITNINSIERAIKESFITPVLYDEKPSSVSLSICYLFSRFLRNSSDKFNEEEIIKQHNADLLKEDFQFEKLSDEDRIKIINNFREGKYTSDYGRDDKSKLTYKSLFMSFRAILRAIAIIGKVLNKKDITSVGNISTSDELFKDDEEGLKEIYNGFTEKAVSSKKIGDIQKYIKDKKEAINQYVNGHAANANILKDLNSFFENVENKRNVDNSVNNIVGNQYISHIVGLDKKIKDNPMFCLEDRNSYNEMKKISEYFIDFSKEQKNNIEAANQENEKGEEKGSIQNDLSITTESESE